MPRWAGSRLTEEQKRLKKQEYDMRRNARFKQRNTVRQLQIEETSGRFDPLEKPAVVVDIAGPEHGLKIAVIPDAQIRDEVPIDHLTACGKFLAEKQPDVIVNIGDWADMSSLSTHAEAGTLEMEGKRYREDIDAARRAMDALMGPIARARGYKPRLEFTLGNHEHRIVRAINAHPRELHGTISLRDLGYEGYGWQVHDFLQPIVIGGVAFCHYFPTGIMGRPITSAPALLRKLHMSAFAGHLQGKDIAFAKRADGMNLIGIISGCLTPDHKVLTADLRYVPLGDLKVGDKLVSFDEVPQGCGGRKHRRRFKTGTLLNIARDIDEVYQVRFISGKSFKVTADHQWLAKTGSKYFWRRTDSLRVGTKIPRLLSEWEAARSYDAGWLAGMYDGEGSLYARETTGGYVMQLAISQKQGPTLDKISSAIDSLFGHQTTTWSTGGAYQLRIKGGAPEIARVLGTLRPNRLLAKFKPELLGNITSAREDLDAVESVFYLGKREIVRSQVDTGTYIAEGYPHHNSFYQHNEEYLSPFTNMHWRGMWMLHEVKDGQFDEMAVSINFLLRKFK